MEELKKWWNGPHWWDGLLGGGSSTDPAGTGTVTDANPSVAPTETNQQVETVTTSKIEHVANGVITDYLDVELDNNSTNGVIRDMWARIKDDWRNGTVMGCPDPEGYNGYYDNGVFHQSWTNTVSINAEQLNGLSAALAPLMSQGTVTVGQLREAILNAQPLNDNGEPTQSPKITEEAADKIIEYEIKRWNSIGHALPTVDVNSQEISLKTQMAYAGIVFGQPEYQYDPGVGFVMDSSIIDKTVTVGVSAQPAQAETKNLGGQEESFDDFASSIGAYAFQPPPQEAMTVQLLEDTWKGMGKFGNGGLFTVMMNAATADYKHEGSYKAIRDSIDREFVTPFDLANGVFEKTMAAAEAPYLAQAIQKSMAMQAVMLMDDGLYPERADNVINFGSSQEKRVAKILEGIEKARETGDREFVRACIYFLHNNGCDLKIENGQLQVVTLPDSSTASLGQDHTVAYNVPGLVHEPESITSGVNQSQPSQSQGIVFG